jgi:hypothetical protein
MEYQDFTNAHHGSITDEPFEEQFANPNREAAEVSYKSAHAASTIQ